MPKGPAVVVVARHGARLDAADKTWHLTSPTPYDPPLTYGGWTQSKALGQRVAAVLHANSANSDTTPSPKRRHRIVIHTSPFLRCIQTSIAIAAGIAQFHPPQASPADHPKPEKALLRIDAFLGEWLSPDYFEDITPPPNSTLMVASAKADLLRREDYGEMQQSQSPMSAQGYFPGGWVKSSGQSATANRKGAQDGSVSAMGSLAQALPHRERSSSQGTMASFGLRASQKALQSLATPNGYSSPVPPYAVSPSDPIPRGYTAHARDACLNVDFQWDSMRAPQEWGDGGEYGEEWSTMHKRFRKGLAGMMAWYREHEWTSKENRPSSSHNGDNSSATAVKEEEEEDLVLILVTHGAGCNALLGAISNQPVLLDVGMASLSMAVRRNEPSRPSDQPPTLVRRSSVIDVGMSNEYELKLLASVDHLRPGVDPSKPPPPPSPAHAHISSPSLEYRRRFTSNPAGLHSPSDSPLLLGEPLRSVNSSLGSIRRSYSSGSSSRYLSNNLGGTPSPSYGLWSGLSPLTQEIPDGRKSPGHDLVLNFRDQNAAPGLTNGNVKPSPSTNGNSHPSSANDKEEHDDVSPLPKGLGRTASQSSKGLWSPKVQKASPVGLWGPPRLDDLAERAQGPKRRWTVTERE